MSRTKFITAPQDEHGNTPYGKIIIEGLTVTEEITFPGRKYSCETCAVSRPRAVSDRWPTFVIGRDVVVLPRNLETLPIGFVTAEAYARVWTWMWQNDIYKCKYSKLNNTMPIHLNGSTWYSRGNRLGFFDEKCNEFVETDDKLLDFCI